MLMTKEHYDLMASFEREHKHCRLTREKDKALWKRGAVYEDGRVNELFLAYRKGYALGAVSGAEHPLLTPSILLVDAGRVYFGPSAVEHARNVGGDPLLSFKTVLGARDVNEALNQKLRPSIDPTGTFRQRDALVPVAAILVAGGVVLLW